ncbi:MAG: YbaN family protein [Ignavibacteriales bacterium]|nr:YbaN family protein [Ignavibacteriales bacterium]
MKKFLLLFTGSLCIVIGVIGIVVPLLPTVPFLLLAAYLYAKGSERFYLWLIHHKWLGTILKNYKEGKGIPVRIRMYSVLFLWLTIGASIVVLIEDTTAKIIMLLVASGITLRLMLMKSQE